MIELYDPARLERQRTGGPLRPLGLALVLTMVAVGAHAFVLKSRVHQLQAEAREIETKLQRAAAPAEAPQALVELKAEVLRLESEAASASAIAPAQAVAVPPSQWMDRLASVGSREVSLKRVEIDRAGTARIEGQAAGASSLSAFVQAWERQDQLTALRPRAIEVKQDKTTAAWLQFQLQATTQEARP